MQYIRLHKKWRQLPQEYGHFFKSPVKMTKFVYELPKNKLFYLILLFKTSAFNLTKCILKLFEPEQNVKLIKPLFQQLCENLNKTNFVTM